MDHSGFVPRCSRRSAFWLWLMLLLAGCVTLPRAPRHVTLVVDGTQRQIETEAPDVRSLLSQAQVTLSGLDRVSPPETASLQDGMTVKVTRVLQYTETFTEPLPFGRRTVRDATLPEGETRLLESGRPGVLSRVYRITEEDGRETERTLISEQITRPPQDEVRLIGTKQQVRTVPLAGTLAYLSHQDAWVMRGSNRSPRRLTALGDLNGQVFSLSPDGTKLLFTRAVTTGDAINSLWFVLTTEAHPEVHPLSLDNVLWADWSPDGVHLAWTTAEVNEQPPGWRGQNDLWVAVLSARDILISKQLLLAPTAGGGYGWWGTRYAWSPNGKSLAYSTPESVGVVSLRERKRVPLLTFPPYRTQSDWAWNPAVAWDAQGTFLATVRHSSAPDGGDPGDSPVFDLWVLAANGIISAEMASEVGMWAAPRYAPDGETLLFGRASVPYQSDLGPYTLCLQDRDGSNTHCLASGDEDSTLAIESPTWLWSPDGESLAFVQRGDIFLLLLADESLLPLSDDGGILRLSWR